MPLNSMQQYVKKLLDGQVSAELQPAEVFIAPPNPGDATVPQVFIWGGQLFEERESFPRGQGIGTGGRKWLHWTIAIWVVYPDDAEAYDINTAFPALLDAILETLRAASLPVPLTDPTTGTASDIFYIGEQIRMEYATPRATEDQRIIWQSARIDAQVDEMIQA